MFSSKTTIALGGDKISFICDVCGKHVGNGRSPIRKVTEVRPVNYKNQIMIKSKDSLKPSRQHDTSGLEIANELEMCARCASSDSVGPRKAEKAKIVLNETLKIKTQGPKDKSSRK